MTGRSQRGDTLIEVVVAFAILVLSLGVLFESFAMTLQRAEKARNLSRAVLTAESLRDRLSVVPWPPRPRIDGRGRGCRWQALAQPIPRGTAERPALLAADRLTLDVRCGLGDSTGRVRLDTVLLVPPR